MKRTLSIFLSLLMVLSCCTALLGVFAVADTVEETPAGKYQVESFAQYTNPDITIWARLSTGEKTINEICNKIKGRTQTDYNWYMAFAVDASGHVTAIDTRVGDDKAANSKPDFEVPEGGFAIGVRPSDTNAEPYATAVAIFDTLKVGDIVKLYGTTVAELANKTDNTLTGVSFDILDGAVQPETLATLPEGAYTLDYAGYKHAAAFSIIAGDGQTVAEVTARGNNGTAKDLNYAYNILVDADGKVVATDYALSKACTFVIPEGGYIVSYNGNKAGYAALANIKVGDAVTLYNVNLTAVAYLVGTQELTSAGFTVTPHTHNFEKKASGSFYFEECTICGDAGKVTNADGVEALNLAVSHNNTYSWGVYDINILSNAGANATSINSNNAFLYAHVYVVETVDGEYVATKYFAPGSAENNTTACPENGFIMAIWTSTRNTDKSTLDALADGKLLGYKLLPQFDISTNFALNTTGDDGYGNLDPTKAVPANILLAVEPAAESFFAGDDWQGEWTETVVGENADWQNADYAPAEGNADALSYKYNYFVKDGKLYVGVKANLPLTKGTGNGNSSFLRVWVKTDATQTSYRYFYEVYVKEDGTLGSRAANNISGTYAGTNSPVNNTESKYEYNMQSIGGGVEAYVVIPLDEIGATDFLRMFITYSIEKATGGAKNNQCLYAPGLAVVEGAYKHITSGTWTDEVGNIGIKVLEPAASVIDGEVNDVIWEGVEWIKVNKDNAVWQSDAKGDKGDVFEYDLAITDDGEYLYVAAVSEAESQTSFRFWINNGTGSVYTSFIDVFASNTGHAAKYNTSVVRNVGAVIENSSLEAAAKNVEGKVTYEFKIKLSDLGIDLEKGFGYFSTVTGKTANGSNDGVYYPAPTGTLTIDNRPYRTNGWDFNNEGLYKKESAAHPVGKYAVKTFAGYFSDLIDVTIMTRLASGEKTINEVSNKLNGRTQTDYNLYKFFTVDANGLVTGVYPVTSSDKSVEGAVKGNVEIPEGGFAIGVRDVEGQDAEYLAIFETLKVGDTVNVYGADPEKLAQINVQDKYINQVTFDIVPYVPMTENVLDLEEVKAINCVTFTADIADAQESVRIYASLDGEEYYDIAAGAAVAVTAGVAKDDFSARGVVNARYIKVVGTDVHGTIAVAEGEAANASNPEGPYPINGVEGGHGIVCWTSEDVPEGFGINDKTPFSIAASQITIAEKVANGVYKILWNDTNVWQNGGHTHPNAPTDVEGVTYENDKIMLGENQIALINLCSNGTYANDGILSTAKWMTRGLAAGSFLKINDGEFTIHVTKPEVIENHLDFDWVSKWTEVKGENDYEWQLSDKGLHSFDYAIKRDGDNFLIGVKYYGDLYAVEGVGAANGNDTNGKATNLRIWMFNPNNTVDRSNFTALIDLGFDGEKFVIDRVDQYDKLASNGGTAQGKMIGDALRFLPGRYDYAIVDGGAELFVEIPAPFVTDDGGLQFILTVSTPEKDGTHNTALFSHSINDEGKYKAAWNPWSSENSVVFKALKLGDYKIRSFAAYVNGDVNLFKRITVEGTELKTLNDIGNYINNRESTDYNAYKVITVDANDRVVGIYDKIGRPANGGDPNGPKGDVEVPEGGFAIGVNIYDKTESGAVVVAKDDAALAIFDTIKVGDYVELFNGTVSDEYTISAYASFSVISWNPEAAEVPDDATKLLYNGRFIADGINVIVPLATGENTVGAISAITTGSAQDFTYWNAVVCDSTGKIIKVVGMVDKTNIEIPEGGFMVLAHGSNAGTVAGVSEGDVVKLYNVDLAAFAKMKNWHALQGAAFEIIPDPTRVYPLSYKAAYTVTENTRTDSYKDNAKKLTDGIYSGNGGTEASSGLGAGATVTVDLGKEYYVDKFDVHAFGGQWGISIINGIKIEYSVDGENFTALDVASTKGEPEDTTWNATWFTVQLEQSVSARYVKFVAVGGNYLWADEVQVWEGEEPVVPYEATVIVKDNAILTDGETGFNGAWEAIDKAKVLLVANAECKQKPMHVSIIDELEAAKKLTGVTLDLYHCAGVMIGYPEGKAVISVSTDGETYTKVGEFDLAAAEVALDKNGTVSSSFTFDEVEAKFVKIELNVGKSTDVLGDSPADGKIYWEFISIAEVAVVEATVVEPTYSIGDVNDDGEIDAADYILIKRHIIGNKLLTGDQLKAADINDDGEVDAADYILVKRHIIGNKLIPGAK